MQKRTPAQKRITLGFAESDESEEPFDQLPLKEAVSKLPEELRLIVSLRFFSQYTVAETAAILNLPQGPVATRQRKALSLLKLELQEEEV